MTEIPNTSSSGRSRRARRPQPRAAAAGARGRRRHPPPARRRPSRRPIRASPPTCSSAAAPPRPQAEGAEPAATPAVAARSRCRSASPASWPAGPAAGGVPLGAGPGGHTQRLLTVVKCGSIQDVKASPVDKVHTWPHLLAAEFVAALACTAFTFVFSIFVNAPLLQLANTNQTPNPSKAPWYFLGLQELLTMFHPMIAGVTIPGVGLIVLIFAPYIDKNPSNKPEDRKFAISLMTVHIMFWAVLVIIGSFFRGPGFNFTLPWRDGLFFDL